MLLLLTTPDDTAADRVESRLRQKGADVLRFDDAQFPAHLGLSLVYTANEGLRHVLHLAGKTVPLEDITAAWDRRPRPATASEQVTEPALQNYIAKESSHFLDDVWETLDCLWLPGKRSAIHRANYKATQLKIATSLGFEIPPTLITNNSKEVLEFYRTHNGNIVSKAFHSSLVQSDSGGGGRACHVHTQPISHRAVGYINSVRYCPVIFQAYVPKQVELRITVVGEQVFAAEIHSQQNHHTRHDWRRYDLGRTLHRPHALPEQVRQLCLEFMAQLELCYGAIDMIVTPEGGYVFLEINPNGQYGWIEQLTGMPIGEAICDLLLSPRTPSPNPNMADWQGMEGANCDQ
ncbi:MAG: hypothetical protein KME08_13325 [Aphanothece sp. CMT-3BRIN-NPC111]|nr:hypothetical protein [Aphanothece sp. CMT-3BRIN-NPC111]